MERDEVFVPKTRSQVGIPPATAQKEEAVKQGESTFEALDEILEDAPLWNLFWVVLQQTLGWPMYLLRNASGQKYGRWTNHFDPNSPIFDKRHRGQIILSDIGILTTMAALITWGQYRGFAEVLRYYIIPYFIVNHHLVLITFLQHTDQHLPHYREAEWTFPRGALCTVDRNLGGAIGAFILHGICETHVSHHICSRIPHYNAWEATEALKSVLGDHYMHSNDNMYYSLVNNYKECKFVEDEGSVLFYRNKLGKSVRKVVYDEDSGVDVKGGASAAASGSEEDY